MQEKPSITREAPPRGARPGNRTLTIHDSGYGFYERERGDSHGPGSGAKFALGL